MNELYLFSVQLNGSWINSSLVERVGLNIYQQYYFAF